MTMDVREDQAMCHSRFSCIRKWSISGRSVDVRRERFGTNISRITLRTTRSIGDATDPSRLRCTTGRERKTGGGVVVETKGGQLVWAKMGGSIRMEVEREQVATLDTWYLQVSTKKKRRRIASIDPHFKIQYACCHLLQLTSFVGLGEALFPC